MQRTPMLNFVSFLRRAFLRLVPSLRALRLATYAVFAFGTLAFAASRSVYADVREMGLGIGHQLAKLEDLTSGAYVIRVNGAEVHRSSTRTAQSTREVLDRFEGYCRSAPGVLGNALSDIPSALEDRINLPKNDPLRAAIVRDETSDRGMVACFVESPSDMRRTAEESLADRMRALAQTGDISKLGRFRYVFAEARASGGTHVVTLWSDGELNLKKMFPASGDAPGADSPVVPRPPASRRTLSAAADGFGGAVRIYESTASRIEVERHYDEALRAAHFRKMAGGSNAEKNRAYLRSDNAEVILSFGGDESRTTVVVVESFSSPNEDMKIEVQP